MLRWYWTAIGPRRDDDGLGRTAESPAGKALIDPRVWRNGHGLGPIPGAATRASPSPRCYTVNAFASQFCSPAAMAMASARAAMPARPCRRQRWRHGVNGPSALLNSPLVTGSGAVALTAPDQAVSGAGAQGDDADDVVDVDPGQVLLAAGDGAADAELERRERLRQRTAVCVEHDTGPDGHHARPSALRLALPRDAHRGEEVVAAAARPRRCARRRAGRSSRPRSR